MKTIIEMARDAGLKPDGDDWGANVYRKAIEAFAALVIANHPPQSFMTWQEGYEAGKQTEREACAKVCEEVGEHPSLTPRHCAESIRSRSEA